MHAAYTVAIIMLMHAMNNVLMLFVLYSVGLISGGVILMLQY